MEFPTLWVLLVAFLVSVGMLVLLFMSYNLEALMRFRPTFILNVMQKDPVKGVVGVRAADSSAGKKCVLTGV